MSDRFSVAPVRNALSHVGGVMSQTARRRTASTGRADERDDRETYTTTNPPASAITMPTNTSQPPADRQARVAHRGLSGALALLGSEAGADATGSAAQHGLQQAPACGGEHHMDGREPDAQQDRVQPVVWRRGRLVVHRRPVPMRPAGRRRGCRARSPADTAYSPHSGRQFDDMQVRGQGSEGRGPRWHATLGGHYGFGGDPG
jgi:hypothetical protein